MNLQSVLVISCPGAVPSDKCIVFSVILLRRFEGSWWDRQASTASPSGEALTKVLTNAYVYSYPSQWLVCGHHDREWLLKLYNLCMVRCLGETCCVMRNEDT